MIGQDTQYMLNGYSFEERVDSEDDNIKIFHMITAPGADISHIDHTPYESLSNEDCERYIKFYESHGRFPTRGDVSATGALRSDNLIELTRDL